VGLLSRACRDTACRHCAHLCRNGKSNEHAGNPRAYRRHRDEPTATGPEALAEFLRKETDMWAEVIRKANIRAV